MNHSMINSSVSMHSLQQRLDILSNNMANLNTNGFKRKDASFEDILTSVQGQPEGFRQQGRYTPLGFTQGWGARLTQMQTDLSQGEIQATGNPADFAIQGNGLFEVQIGEPDANGERRTAWTRNGAFNESLGADGVSYLTTKEGYFVNNSDGNRISIPAGMRPVVEANGQITGYNEDGTYERIGDLKLVRVIRPHLLQDSGNNLYTLSAGVPATEQASVLQAFVNETDTDISVKQGFLEQSNVKLATEMADLIMVQRALQFNSRAITSSDQMMNIANNLRA